MKHTESKHAIALNRWAVMHRGKLPGIELLFHVPNGGRRNLREAARLKAEGVRPGVPDYWLPFPLGGWRGMLFELKSPGEYPTKEQKWWFARLMPEGWIPFVAWDWMDAAELISDYLELRLKAVDLAPGMRPKPNVRMYGAEKDFHLPTP